LEHPIQYFGQRDHVGPAFDVGADFDKIKRAGAAGAVIVGIAENYQVRKPLKQPCRSFAQLSR
jgi:hypothetical protein